MNQPELFDIVELLVDLPKQITDVVKDLATARQKKVFKFARFLQS